MDSSEESSSDSEDEAEETVVQKGWAIDFLEAEGAVRIYTMGTKHTVHDFQPMLKRIIEDAFDSKVRMWINSIEYVEDEDEQNRIRGLVQEEITQLNRWMFGSECTDDSVPGIQSRYLLLKHGTEPNSTQLEIELPVEKQASEAKQATYKKYVAAMVDNVAYFKVNYYKHPIYILLCLLSIDSNEQAFWLSLYSENNKSIIDSMNFADLQIPKTYSKEAVTETFENINYANARSDSSNDALVLGELRRLSDDSLANVEKISEFLSKHLTGLKGLHIYKNTTGGQQYSKIGENWKDIFIGLLSAEYDKVAFQRTTEHPGPFPPSYQMWCEAIVTKIRVQKLQSRQGFNAMMVGGALVTRDQTKKESVKDKEGRVDGAGLDIAYAKYQKVKKEPRQYRIGNDLLSMHLINPLCDNFYEAAR